ncbi:hypothetical protein NC652_016931 [Populus alba x Populus x berolinensis]|nr:hypothetical protein NC652_016931 [Populus alba x Populus x berolinensis]
MSAKRRAVYSLEPNVIGKTLLARNYVNHLVSALMKIKEDDKYGHDSELQKPVRYEVDMALVMSTPGLAWSQALRSRLHKNINAGRFHDSHHDNSSASLKCPSMHGPRVLKNDANAQGSPRLSPQMRISSSPNGKAKTNKNLKRARSKKEEAKQSEEEQIGSRVASLRSLLPGGMEMGDDELFSEMGSYITGLEMKVNILRCLVDAES